jgi:dTMP kinase
VAEAATAGLWPDLTIFLDVPVDAGLARVGKRGSQDRLESEAREFHERVRAGYLEMSAREPRRWARVDGDGPPDDVARRVLAIAEGRGMAVGQGRGLR